MVVYSINVGTYELSRFLDVTACDKNLEFTYLGIGYQHSIRTTIRRVLYIYKLFCFTASPSIHLSIQLPDQCLNAEPQHCANGRMGIRNDLQYQKHGVSGNLSKPMLSMPGETKPPNHQTKIESLDLFDVHVLRLFSFFILWGQSCPS